MCGLFYTYFFPFQDRIIPLDCCFFSGASTILSGNDLDSEGILSVLEILLGDESDDVKAQKLMQTDTPWIAPERWATLIKAFDGPAELYDLTCTLVAHNAGGLREWNPAHGPSMTPFR